MDFDYTVTTVRSFEDAVAMVEQETKKAGFRVLYIHDVSATLKEKGLKLTPQRMLIVEIIHDAKGHLTADEIIRYVQAKMPGVNKSTIYRTLDLLEESGCVYKSEMGNEAIYHHDDAGHHHHLMCSLCGKTVDCNEDIFTPILGRWSSG